MPLADVVPLVDEIFRQLLELNRPVDSSNENVCKDGRVIHCEWRNIPYRDNSGQTIGFVSMVQDVTHQKSVEKALKASESLFQACFQ